MELTFVSNDSNASSRLKRSQACKACRKRKKRCSHARGDLPANNGELPVDDRQQTPKSPVLDHPLDEILNKDALATQRGNVVANETAVNLPSTQFDGHHTSHQSLQVKPSVWRFVGDLHPEALFQRQESVGGLSQSGRDKVGVWQSQHERNELTTPPDPARIRTSLASSSQTIRTNAHDHLVEDFPVIPPESDRAKLIDIYFDRINKIIPLIDEESFRASIALGSSPLILTQAMCLATAKDHSAGPYLRLNNDPKVLSVQDFCHALARALDSAFQGRTERDKLILIRALALSSLHVEGPDGAEESSMQLMQAVHHAQTLGLHLDTARTELQDESLGNLFWSLWSLDRLNSCINGRPIMISNIDIGIKIRSSSHRHNNDAFRVWLRIADMVDKIIEFYRPSTDELLTGWENDFPGFEEIVRDCAALQLPIDALQTLELFYHALAITSCRSQSFKNAPKSTPSTIRQAFSAICITRILEDEGAKTLLPLPVVPYSLSLALSATYKQLRQTRMLTSRLHAMTQLKVCCQLLDNLSGTWWSAGAMAKLGRRALTEASKAPGIPRNNNLRLLRHGSNTLEIQGRNAGGTEYIASHEHAQSIGISDRGDGHDIGLTPESLTMQENTSDIPSGHDIAAGGFIQDNFNIPMDFYTSFDGIDQVLGDYLDLNLPTNFGDPLFIDDFYLPDQSILDKS